MAIKPLADYTAEDMNIPEFRADAVSQVVAAIVALNEAAVRNMNGLAASLTAYETLRNHPAYAHLSAEHRTREIAAAHGLFNEMDDVRDAARATLLALDPDAEV